MKGERIIKKFIINLFIIFIVLIIQLIIPPLFSAGIKPDLLLVFVIVVGLLDGTRVGGLYGFITGMLQDLILGGMFGLYTIVKAFSGGIVGFLEGIIFKEKIIFIPLIIFIATYFHEFMIILLSEQLIFNIDFVYVIKSMILPEAIINSLIGFIVYFLYYKINQPRRKLI